MCLNSFLKASKGNNRISKSRAFHNVGAAYTKDLSKNELAHVLLIGGTHNKQGSKDARVRIVVLLTLGLIKSHKYTGAVLLTALCVKSKIIKKNIKPNYNCHIPHTRIAVTLAPSHSLSIHIQNNQPYTNHSHNNHRIHIG